MKQKYLYGLWAGLFIVCAGLGFIPAPGGFLRFGLTALSVLFFLPPVLLLYGASLNRDKQTAKRVFWLSLCSLVLTLLALILNFMGAIWSETAGNLLHGLLVILSTPMIASGYWVLSLFLWACVLMVSISLLRKKASPA